MVFCRCANHRRATDIYLLNRGVPGDALSDGLNKRIQIHNYQLKGEDLKILQFALVIFKSQIRQDAAVDLWVQGLYATIE